MGAQLAMVGTSPRASVAVSISSGGISGGLSLGTVPPHSIAAAMLITFGWASLAALFSFSIAMVVWGRHGDGSINF